MTQSAVLKSQPVASSASRQEKSSCPVLREACSSGTGPACDSGTAPGPLPRGRAPTGHLPPAQRGCSPLCSLCTRNLTGHPRTCRLPRASRVGRTQQLLSRLQGNSGRDQNKIPTKEKSVPESHGRLTLRPHVGESQALITCCSIQKMAKQDCTPKCKGRLLSTSQSSESMTQKSTSRQRLGLRGNG